MTTPLIPLEDTYSDILSKARRGRGLDVATAASQAGITEKEATAAFDGTGELDINSVRALAGVLGLEADRLVALAGGIYVPAPIVVDGLAAFNTPFDDMTVNSYLVWDKASGSAIAFDTGMDCDGILDRAAAEKVRIELILLTHSHGDHIYDLDRLKSKTGAPAWIGEKEPVEGAQPFAVGRTFQAGGLSVETRSTWGHSPGGITYIVKGLSTPVAIVGDALFAGSMGGGTVSYESALKTNRENLFTLPDATVICPGHGPLSTIGEQKKANPFYPEL